MEDMERKIKRVVLKMLRERPFYGYVLLCTSIHADDGIATACTDGRKIYYSPKFFSGKTEDFILKVMEHEVMHIVLDHLTRMKGKDQRLWNIAADMVIEMIQGGEPKIPAVEQVYQDLLSKKDQMLQKPIGDHEMMLPAEDIDSQEIEEMVQRAWAQAAATHGREKAYGSLPLPIADKIKQLTAPKVRWHNIVSQYLVASAERVPTWQRPSKRSPLGTYLPGSRREKELHVIVGIDVSGSISQDTLQKFISECISLLKSFKVQGTVIQFDSQIQKVEEISDSCSIFNTRYGSGGTSFVPVFDYVAKNHNDHDIVVIMFTDLAGEFPNYSVRVPVIWIVPDPKDVSAPFGTIVGL